jgi:hypothetical protein
VPGGTPTGSTPGNENPMPPAMLSPLYDHTC